MPIQVEIVSEIQTTKLEEYDKINNFIFTYDKITFHDFSEL